MYIVMIEPKSPGVHVFNRTLEPRLGLPLLGAVLCALGHRVKIYCETLAPIDWEEVARADIVGISSITSTALKAYEIGDRVRRLEIPVIMGGVHPTFVTEESLEHSDWVVRGEGEETLPELLEVIAHNRNPRSVLGLSWKEKGVYIHNKDRPLVGDLDSLPFPDLSLIEGHEKISPIPIITSRGCPFSCTFCSITPMFGRKYRTRSTKSVVDEIEKISPKKVFFYDDIFNANRERMLEICQMIIDRGIKLEWIAQVRTNIVKYKGEIDSEGLELMRRSGASVFCIGLESINPDTLSRFKKQQNLSDIEDSIRIAHKYGIAVHGMFILGSDSDNIDTVAKTLEFALKKRIDTAQFLILTPYPGTEEFVRLKTAKRIVTTDWSQYSTHHAVYIPDLIKAEVLQRQMLEAFKEFYRLRHVIPFLTTGRRKTIFFRTFGLLVVRKWERGNTEKIKSIEDEHRSYLLSLPPDDRENIRGAELYDLS